MFQVRIPYTLVALLIGLLVLPIPAALGIAALIEIIFCILLVRALRSSAEFNYESFYGQLLSQLTISGEIELGDIIHHISARVASYLMAGGIIYFCYSWWLLIIPAVLFLSTITFRT